MYCKLLILLIFLQDRDRASANFKARCAVIGFHHAHAVRRALGVDAVNHGLLDVMGVDVEAAGLGRGQSITPIQKSKPFLPQMNTDEHR